MKNPQTTPTFKFHHLGIACKSFVQCKEIVNTFFEIKSEGDVIFDSNQDAILCLLTNEEDLKIELISGNIVQKFVNNNQNFYHTCFRVENINNAIVFLKRERKSIVISEPKPSMLFNNCVVAFLYTPIGIVELIQKNDAQ
ncbi:MAG: hypothetical protein HOB18_14935 [Nitrospina sp.]|jgi:hypothetical protein|nr:hypothetical protein [Nitrospina sp.]